MRLLVVTSSFPRHPDDVTNAGVFVAQLATELDAAGHDVTVVSPQPTDADRWPFATVRIRWPGEAASLTHVDTGRFREKLRFATLVASGILTTIVLTLRHRPDRLVALWAVPSGLFALPAAIIGRRPYDVWALGSDIWRIDDYPQGRRLLQAILRRADRRFADGVALADDVEAIGGLPCAFLPSSRRLPAPDPHRSAPVDDGRIRLLTVARFHEHKGVDVLIDAVAALTPDQRRRLRLDVWGGGPDEADLHRRIGETGVGDTITMHGFIGPQGFADAARDADIAIVPSRIESIPVVLSDYAAAGVPLIVTDTGDMGALVERFGAGDVVPAGSVDALAAAISRVIDGARPGTPAGRSALADHLSLDRSVAELTSSAG